MDITRIVPGFNFDPSCVFFSLSLRCLPPVVDYGAEMSHILPPRSGMVFRILSERIDRLNTL